MDMKKLVLIVSLFAAQLPSADYAPPAQGPPLASPTTAASKNIALEVTLPLKLQIEEQLIRINTALAARTDARAKVTLSNVHVYAPIIFVTRFTDRPNHVFGWSTHMFTFQVSNIQWSGVYHCRNGIPWGCDPSRDGQIGWTSYPWNRTISMGVEIRAFCNGWENGTGRVTIVSDPSAPLLDSEPSFTEAVVDFFLGHTLVPYVNAQVSSVLSEPGGGSITVLGDQGLCVSIGISGPSDTAEHGAILWNNPSSRVPPFTLPVTVRPLSVKRLRAHTPAGDVVYDAVEAPHLNLWMGFGRWSFDLPPMVEGQEVLLPAPAIEVYPRPSSGMQLLVLATLSDQSITDSNFRLFPSSVNYGNGIQKVTILKTYWQPPIPPLRKPFAVPIAAYEVTFEVSAPGPSLPPVTF